MKWLELHPECFLALGRNKAVSIIWTSRQTETYSFRVWFRTRVGV